MDFFSNIRVYKTNPKPLEPEVELPIWDVSHNFFTEKIFKTESKETSSASVEIDENGYYDIYDLNDQVKTLLKNQPSVNLDKKEKYEWIIANSTDAKEKREAMDRLFDLEQNIIIANQFDTFLKKASHIIQEYYAACEETSTFFFKDLIIQIIDTKVKLQGELLTSFLSLCQEYVSIRTINKNPNYTSCCENPIIIYDGCLNSCSNCLTSFVTIDSIGNFNDQRRIATNSKPKYYNIKHFNSAIKKSQGIHKKTIDPIVNRLQDEYMKHHNISLENYTIFDLMDLLSRNSVLSQYYKDIHLIYRQKTGKQINNLSNVEEELPKWYKEQDVLSETIKLKENSKNSINAYYMVCRLAQLKGGRIDLEIKNFFCARDEKTIAEYDACFEARCYKLGWLKSGEKLTNWCK